MPESQKYHIATIKEWTSKNWTEHFLNILKAGLATTGIGGGIVSLINDYIPSSKQQRLEKFVEQIAVDLERLQNKVNEEAILNDDFAFIFEKCFRGVAENYQKEKLQAFRGILVNSAINTDLKEEEKEYFLNLVNNLSVLHIRILKFLAMPMKYLADINILADKIEGDLEQIFSIVIPGIDLEAIKVTFDDLYRYGLISTDKHIFNSMTTTQGLTLVGNRITPFGKSFMEFCVVPNDQ